MLMLSVRSYHCDVPKDMKTQGTLRGTACCPGGLTKAKARGRLGPNYLRKHAMFLGETTLQSKIKNMLKPPL